MPRELAATLLVAVLVLTAGCAGFGSDDDPGPETGTPTATPEPTATATTTPEPTATATATATRTATPTATPVPARFAVSVFNTNAPPSAGSELVVLAAVNNTGDRPGTQTVELRVDERGVTDSQTVTLDGGDREIVELVWQTTEDDAGNSFNVTVSSEDEVVSVGEG
jgi:hypothetical protein